MTPHLPPTPPPDDSDDANLLAREMAGVKRLDSPEREPSAREKFDRELAERRRAAATENAPASSRFAVDGLSSVQAVAGDAYLEFRRDGIQLRQWQKLRKGQIAWTLAVDLHGITREEAMRAVERLIRQAQDEDSNCVRVVHGKGHDPSGAAITIKAELNHWLRKHPQVLAFCSALPADGGAGALYLLLRRQRRE